MIGIDGYRWSLRGTKVQQPMQCCQQHVENDPAAAHWI
ncbi:DUF3710 domain-containing protein [Cupriavidus cauae]|jgi:hypothetical protein|nr:DUF3710 domain-containing protein [Cupriavidus cauae]